MTTDPPTDPAGTNYIAAALVAFQAAAPTVTKGQTARIENRSGETSYTYTYANLADVTDVAYPLLTAHGLAFTCLPRRTDTGAYELLGILLHTSGQQLTGALPISGSTAQQVGSSLTYNRRYLFGCMTGLITDEDDDGAHASRPQAQRPEQQLGVDDGSPMTSPTRARMFGRFSQQGIVDRDEQIRGIVSIIGREIESRGELTEAEAQRVVDVLKRREQAGAGRPRGGQGGEQQQPAGAEHGDLGGAS